jgi:hypothetical protein
MKLCASAVIAARPTDGSPSLIFSVPPSAKNSATLAGFWLHQAAVYLVAKSLNCVVSIGISLDSQPARIAKENAVTIIARKTESPGLNSIVNGRLLLENPILSRSLSMRRMTISCAAAQRSVGTKSICICSFLLCSLIDGHRKSRIPQEHALV